MSDERPIPPDPRPGPDDDPQAGRAGDHEPQGVVETLREEIEEAVERLARHRAREHVASDHDELYSGSSNVLEYRIERREISMNVIDRGHPFHPRIQANAPVARKAEQTDDRNSRMPSSPVSVRSFSVGVRFQIR